VSISTSSVSALFGNSSVQNMSSVGGTSRRHPQGDNPLESKVLSAVAEKLGMNVSDLQSATQNSSLAQVASDHGVSRDDLVSTIKSVLEQNPPPGPPPGSGDSGSTNLSNLSTSSTSSMSGVSGTSATSGTSSAPSLDDLASMIADDVKGSHQRPPFGGAPGMGPMSVQGPSTDQDYAEGSTWTVNV